MHIIEGNTFEIINTLTTCISVFIKKRKKKRKYLHTELIGGINEFCAYIVLKWNNCDLYVTYGSY